MLKAINAQNAYLGGVVADLRVALAVKAAHDAQASSGPQKGLAYEAAVRQLVHGIAEAAGDGGADAVGGCTGADGTRKGDVPVELRSQTTHHRMAVQAKNRPGRPAPRGRPVGHPARPGADRPQRRRRRLRLPGRADARIASRPLVIDSRRTVVAWDLDAGGCCSVTGRA